MHNHSYNSINSNIFKNTTMKKLFTIVVTILICSFVEAQFKPQDLRELTQEQANEFSREVATNAKTQWTFVGAQENAKSNYYIVNYAAGEKTLKVIYNIYFSGENKALEIPGVKTYKFYQVSGSYLDLFPTWKKVFRPDADLEATVDDLKSQELLNKAENINFKLKGSDDQWQLRNWN